MNIANYKNTKLYEIEQFLYEASGKLYKFHLNELRSSFAKKMPSMLSKDPMCAKNIGGWIVDSQHNGHAEVVTPAFLKQCYSGDSSLGTAMRQKWASFDEFCIELSAYAKMYENEEKASALKALKKISNATEVLGSSLEIKIETTALCTGIHSVVTSVTQPDEDFLYSHLRKDEQGNMYWLFGTGLQQIPIAETSSGSRITDDDVFWTLFYAENGNVIQKYLENIVDCCYDVSRESTNGGDDDSLIESIESRIEKVVPHVIMQNVCIDREFIHYPSQGSESPAHNEFKRFGISMNARNKSLSKENWLEQLSVSLIRFVDRSKIKLVTQWGDSDSIYSYSGDSRILHRFPAEIPMLPPHWRSFMDGKLACPTMGLLRLAGFVVSALDKRNFSRQALYLCGSGKEGKGVMTKALSHIFGEAQCTINESQLTDDARFGLETVVNKRLVVMQDIAKPTAIFESPLFRSITGNDVISVDRKFRRPFEWKVQGTKVIIVTNKKVWLNNNYAVTRILPLHLLKNYEKAISVMDISADLISEEDGFVQWCYDYLNFMMATKNANGSKFSSLCGANGLPLLSDDQFENWLNCSEFYVNEEDYNMKMAFMYENRDGAFFEIKLNEDTEECDDMYFEELANRLFVFTEGSTIKRGQIAEAIATDMMNIKKGSTVNPIYSLLGMNTGDRIPQNKMYRAFLEFLRTHHNVTLYRTHTDSGYRGISLKILNAGGEAINFPAISPSVPYETPDDLGGML